MEKSTKVGWASACVCLCKPHYSRCRSCSQNAASQSQSWLRMFHDFLPQKASVTKRSSWLTQEKRNTHKRQRREGGRVDEMFTSLLANSCVEDTLFLFLSFKTEIKARGKKWTFLLKNTDFLENHYCSKLEGDICFHVTFDDMLLSLGAPSCPFCKI